MRTSIMSHHTATTTVESILLSNARVTVGYYGSDVLHVKIRLANGDDAHKHLFIFEYGCLSFFNFTVEEEQAFSTVLMQFADEILCDREREVGVEDLAYVYGSHSAVFNDTVTLSGDSSLEKLSVAFAMAQGVKLNVFEERVDEEISENKDLPESLAKTGKIGLSRDAMARKIGKLFIERNNVNLHADILDDPEFFWEQSRYKDAYDMLYRYLELKKRHGLLNQRLEIMKELFDMISDQLENLHAEKLELIIIWLIVVEVVIAVGWQILLKDVFGFFQH